MQGMQWLVMLSLRRGTDDVTKCVRVDSLTTPPDARQQARPTRSLSLRPEPMDAKLHPHAGMEARR